MKTIDVTGPGFAAKGDGTTDDTAAFQRAVDALVNTGGVIWVPAGRSYVIGDVSIASLYQIWIKSEMYGKQVGGTDTTAFPSHGVVKPKNGATYIFQWAKHASAVAGYGGGGGISGLVFADVDNGATTWRGNAITAAVYIDDAQVFTTRDCSFGWIAGTCVKVGSTTYCMMENCRTLACGDTGKSPISVGETAHTANFGPLRMHRCFIEATYANAPAVKVSVTGGGGLHAVDCYFENVLSHEGIFIDGEGPSSNNGPLIEADGCEFQHSIGYSAIRTSGFRSKIVNCTFNCDNGSASCIWIDAQQCIIRGCRMSTIQTSGKAIELTSAALDCTINDMHMYAAGQIDVSATTRVYLSDIHVMAPYHASGPIIDLGANHLDGGLMDGSTTATGDGVRCSTGSIRNYTVTRMSGGKGFECTDASGRISGCTATSLDGGVAFTKTSGMTFEGNFGDDSGVTWKTTVRKSITIPLNAFVEVDGNEDVGNTAANGGVLASDTTPILRGNATHGMQEISWAAGNTDYIMTAIAVPEDIDTTQDVLVDLVVYTDNAGGGGIDAAGFGVFSVWDDNAGVTDLASDAGPATTPHTITATIGTGDVTSQTLGIRLQPGVHANDPVQLTGVRVRYVAKITTLGL